MKLSRPSAQSEHVRTSGNSSIFQHQTKDRKKYQAFRSRAQGSIKQELKRMAIEEATLGERDAADELEDLRQYELKVAPLRGPTSIFIAVRWQ